MRVGAAGQDRLLPLMDIQGQQHIVRRPAMNQAISCTISSVSFWSWGASQVVLKRTRNSTDSSLPTQPVVQHKGTRMQCCFGPMVLRILRPPWWCGKHPRLHLLMPREPGAGDKESNLDCVHALTARQSPGSCHFFI